jgi:hypothetical protein
MALQPLSNMSAAQSAAIIDARSKERGMAMTKALDIVVMAAGGHRDAIEVAEGAASARGAKAYCSMFSSPHPG